MPFLKRKESSASGIIIKNRAPDESSEPEDKSAGHEACARDLLRAIENKDIKGIASALQAAFEVMELEPHEEGPHTYAAQNEMAAEEQE